MFKRPRIPVDLVADMLAQGAGPDEILEGYPTLNEEMLSLAPLYVHTSSCKPLSLAAEMTPQVTGPAFLLLLNVGLMVRAAACPINGVEPGIAALLNRRQQLFPLFVSA